MGGPASATQGWALLRFARLVLRREERPIAVVALLALAFLLWKARWLRYPDLAFHYPFVTFDSFQWMLDAYAYSGRDVDMSWRNPGLPLVLALLGSFREQRLLPLLTSALCGAMFAYLALMLRRTFAPLPSALALLLLFFNFGVQTAFDLVLADQWAVAFQTMALYHVLEGQRAPRHLVFAGLLGACSLLFQYGIVWLVPALLLFHVLELRGAAGDRARTDRFALLGVGAAALLFAPVLLYKWARFHDPLYSKVIQFPLLGFHLFGIPFYALCFAAFFGLPAAVLVASGAIAGLRRRGAERLAILCLVSTTAFWVLFYVWLDPRFLLYALPMVAFPLARALSTLAERSFFAFRRSPLRSLAGWALVGLSLLYALYDREDPYTRHLLPVAPRMALVFPIMPITNWSGNVTVRLDGAEVRRTESPPALRFLTTYYRSWRARGSGAPEADDLAQIARRAEGAAVAECGPLPQDYFSAMRRELAIARRLLPCGSPAEFALQPAATPSPEESTEVSGRIYRLVRLGRR
jgi:hypothetical protein